jgi:hypothetical protein
VGDKLLIVTSSCLGRGAFGTVYKGYFYQDHKIDYTKPLAIKETELGSCNYGNEMRM